MILISKLVKPEFFMNISVSLQSEEENVTNLIKIEGEEEEPYLTLNLIDNKLTLKYSNIFLEYNVNDTSYFYVEIYQLYMGDKVQKSRIFISRYFINLSSC